MKLIVAVRFHERLIRNVIDKLPGTCLAFLLRLQAGHMRCSSGD